MIPKSVFRNASRIFLIKKKSEVLTCVNPHVHVVGHPLVEALAAELTPVFLPISMNLHVRAQVTAVVEVFATLGTRSRELPSALVNGAVVLVIAQLAELLPALTTLERLFPGVGPEVNLEQSDLRRSEERGTSRYC